jgi:hypothetical protein
MVEPDGLTAGQWCQNLGEVVAARCRRAVDQDGDHLDVAHQGGRDLQHDEVVGIVESAAVVFVGGASQPFPITASNTSQDPTALSMASA